jgi:hypothetical protein
MNLAFDISRKYGIIRLADVAPYGELRVLSTSARCYNLTLRSIRLGSSEN